MSDSLIMHRSSSWLAEYDKKWTAIYTTSPGRDIKTLKKVCAYRNYQEVREYVGQVRFRRLLHDVRKRRIGLIVVYGLDQFPGRVAALVKLLGWFADEGVPWYDAMNNLSTGDVNQFVHVLRQQDAKMGARIFKSGRGRPREDFDFKEAVRWREAGAPLWFIQEQMRMKFSGSTLSRRLQKVKQGPRRPRSYWETLFGVQLEKARSSQFVA
jgi:hypothetical protein